ncbi:hypothetical protein EHQ53_12610 [Leptospira langatensis]|uniref:Fibronectin type III domain-containing protein n=1 Tax=Leptospira langatensis TaxID=2484983 RepID=A0A5F1ZQE7_9LEPT|nr:hypothetical protein [Leptospira langatensis]TGK02775.1 hypothetical protein EHO57_05500 [Leptospira langatensis]TGL40020.1 hypothetical protein EHQ53_12610 [Leptospira langatensis]
MIQNRQYIRKLLFLIPFLFSFLLAEGIYSQQQRISLRWKASAGAVEYIVELCEDKEFTSVHHSYKTKNTRYEFHSQDSKYFVRVVGLNAEGVRGVSSPVISLEAKFAAAPKVKVERPSSVVAASEELRISLGDPNMPAVSNSNTSSAGTPTKQIPVTTYYRVNGGDWQKYDGSISLINEGWNEVEFYSEDILGNKETPKKTRYLKDTTPPLVRLVGQKKGPSGLYEIKSGAELTLQITEEGSGMEEISVSLYSRDGSGAEENVSRSGEEAKKPITISSAGIDGLSILRWEANDKAGNSIQSELPLLLDARAPTCVFAPTEGKLREDGIYYLKENGLISVRCEDPATGSGLSKLEYKIGNGPLTAYQTPIGFPVGAHTVTVYASDLVGNRSEFKIKVNALRPDWQKAGTELQEK